MTAGAPGHWQRPEPMQRIRFWRLHLATGEKTQGEMDARNRLELLESLNAYNRVACGAWQYWATP